MGIVYKKSLHGESDEKILVCNNCKTHFATYDQILSKNFHGQYGKAYLFNTVINVYTGEAEDRSMRTGLHTVQDIHCAECSTVVGWKYLVAYEPSEQYKEGHFILERTLLHCV
ncbi:Yippee/Mis18 [Gamsiella multidivaricata]|uniref:Yippee/Mis18 n=1 Tax=Gamsiella multidivaricata TaxID=101098 RepID=UPI00221F3E15|nr:Yippee/Mis18 [Gamsiella multidivaricata]KAI7821351.1 Yippee/Mis18 [Gamsiella multidivaricata]